VFQEQGTLLLIDLVAHCYIKGWNEALLEPF
jgi:hypothetical protein